MKTLKRLKVSHLMMSLTLLAGLNLLSASSLGEGFVSEAKAASVTEQFSKISQSSQKTVNHSQFSRLLKAFIKRDKTGLNRVDYKGFKNKQGDLKAYIKSLEAVKVTSLAKAEQFAFWANLYNAVTIDVVLDAYPVKTIKDIDISPGIFSNGPWGKKLVTIEGTQLSLDDIEHKILRTIFKDPRVHYAVNCASIGCPNLQNKAFTGTQLNAQLDQAARDYVNSNRGVVVQNGRVSASKIYAWFKKDFGPNQSALLAHFKKYADSSLKTQLNQINTINRYFYDWTLNDTAK